MGLREEIEKLKLDTRLLDWNLKHNRITPEELQKHLASLPDLSSQAVTLDNLEDRSVSNGHGDFQPYHS